jgi:hypothetical protein
MNFSPPDYTTHEISQRIRQRREWEEAAAHRQAWAEAHGCVDFKEVMRLGIQAVGRRVQTTGGAGSAEATEIT